MNIKNILITGSRAPAALFLIRKLSKYGHRIFCAESISVNISSFSNCVIKNYKIKSPKEDFESFKKDLIEVIKKEKISLLIPTCEEIFYISKAKSELEQYCEIFCDDLDVLAELHNKWSFVNKKFENVNFPKSWLIKNKDELKKVFSLGLYDKYILKPVYSRFASKTKVVFKNDNLDKIALDNKDYILQEFIEGEQFCSYSIIKDNKIFLHSDYKTKYSADLGATIAFSFENNKKIFDFVNHFAKTENFKGQIAFDFILDKNNNLYLIECNPRLTSGIQLFEDDKSVSCAFVEKAFEKVVFPKSSTKSILGFAMFLYGTKNIKTIKNLLDWFKTMTQSKDVIFDSKDIKPFLFQGFMLFYMLYKSIKHKISIKEISTYDIEWNGKNEK